LLCIGVCLCKFAYAPLLALLLLIPAQNFGGRTRYFVKVAALIIAGAAVSAFWIFSSSNLETKINLSSSVSAPAQFEWLVHHPFRIAPLLLETFCLRGWPIAQSYVCLIGWSDMYLPTWFVIGYLMLLAAACLVGEDKPALPPARRTAFVVLPAVACSFLTIALLSYLYWTPVRASFIDGIGGRYLIPLSPAFFLFICFSTRRLHLRIPRMALDRGMILISLGVCIYFIVVVWRRYYG